MASPVLRVSWAASGLSGALAALLRPCGLDHAPELGAAGGLGDLQAVRCALWRGPGGLAGCRVVSRGVACKDKTKE